MTSKKDIFDKFLVLVKDRTLCKLTDEEMVEILSQFLSASRSLYFQNCRKDLDDRIPFKYYEQTFVGDEIETTFILDEYDNTYFEQSLSVFVTQDDEDLPFTFDYDDGIITITPAPLGEFIAGYVYTGDFVEELSEEEQWILAHGMVIVWTSNQVRDYDKLKERMTSRDFHSLHSPANLLDKLITLREHSLMEVQRMRVNYSFNSIEFDGFK